MLGLTAKPYVALIAIIAICALTGAAFVKGIGIGAKTEAAKWQADKIKDQQAAAEKAAEAREKIAELEYERNEKLLRGGEDIAEIHVVQTPARIEIQKQIVERPVYRDCRVDDGMLQLINDARAGRGLRTEAVPVAEDSVSGKPASRF